jgi:F-type H+-transporting ATPase subunit delta
MRGESRTSFANLRDLLPEALAEARRAQTGPAQTGPAQTGPAQTGPTRTGRGRSAPSGTTGSTAGSGTTGSRAASSRASSRSAPSGTAPSGTGGLTATVGDELFSVLSLLDREHALRRALSDPSKPADEKGAIVIALLHGKVTPATEEIVAATVRARWASPSDMTDALERLAVEAFAIAAEEDQQLDDLEDELFRFGRVVAGEPDLRAALTEPTLPADRKRDLLNALLGGKVTPVALRLITEMSLYSRGRSLVTSLEMCTRIAAERRQRLIAVVRAAIEPTAPQRRRLADALAAIYGHEVYINVIIDPAVVGGMTIHVGDELIDASVVSRLVAVRRKLAG